MIVGAGSETTAGVLCGTTALLLEHPEAMARVTEEVRSAFSSDGEINLERVDSRLPYLRACIDEAMRLYPVPGCASLRITGDRDIICGVPMPPKVRFSSFFFFFLFFCFLSRWSGIGFEPCVIATWLTNPLCNISLQTVVGLWPYAVYRDPKLWRNPDEFHPERWLGDPEYINDARKAFNPFHIGSRDCVGRG